MKATGAASVLLLLVVVVLQTSAAVYAKSRPPLAFTAPFFCQRRRTANCSSRTIRNSRLSTTLNMSGGSLMECMSDAVAKSLGRDHVKLKPTRGGGAGGGGGASISAAMDELTGEKYFIKTASMARGGGKMLRAEYLGIKEMDDSRTIKVPKPIAYGEGGTLNQAFVVFEYLDMGGGGSGFEMGVQLAKMHRCISPDGFGFHVDNTCGATPQPNLPYCQDWPEFWDEMRLGHMLKLTHNCGLSQDKVDKLRAKTKELLSHSPQPSLLHGDLWGGNTGYAKVDGKQVPVIFDPATYYGDREADIAMTYLFGGFGRDFYEGYESEWPLPEGHEKRKTIYNLYHIMNHCVLFGGGYCSQAKGMMEQILRM